MFSNVVAQMGYGPSSEDGFHGFSVVAEEMFTSSSPEERFSRSSSTGTEPTLAAGSKRQRPKRAAAREMLAKVARSDDDDASPMERRKAGNRASARRSRERKRMVLACMGDEMQALRRENANMRLLISKAGASSAWTQWALEHAPSFVVPTEVSTAGLGGLLRASGRSDVPPGLEDVAASDRELRKVVEQAASSVEEPDGGSTPPNVVLEDSDFALICAIELSARHFLVTDPNAPDNPIVFASQGFYDLTEYTPEEVIGKNCRFLQGPGTDQAAVTQLRKSVQYGTDVHVVIKNFTKSGRPFWNDLFMAPLHGPDGRVIHFIGVQAEISDEKAQAFFRVQQRAMASAIDRQILNSIQEPMRPANTSVSN